MRTVSDNTIKSTESGTPHTRVLQTFSTTLSDDRVVTIREMTGRDLIYMEEELDKVGETKKSFYLMERLTVGEQTVTFDEVANLPIRDIKKISELVSKANGEDDGEGDGNPDPK